MTDQPSDTIDNTTVAVNPADFIEETLPDAELTVETQAVESKPKEEAVTVEQPAKPKKQIIQQKAIQIKGAYRALVCWSQNSSNSIRDEPGRNGASLLRNY